MNLKLLLSFLTILLAFTAVGQSLKIDTFKPARDDTSSVIRWQCHAGASTLPKDNYPLIIINGKAFKNCLLQNIFFNLDSTTISGIRVLNPKSDSVRLYGKMGENGVIIITTQKTIEWISAKQILKQNSNAILSPYKRTLIKVDNAYFDTDEELFFQKHLIDNISVDNNISQLHADKQFNCIVTISLTKKRGT